MSQVEIAQRSARGSFALFAGNFLSTAVSFVAIVLITRLLGASNYGAYTLCVLLPNLLLNVLGFGVNSGVTRYAAYNISLGKPDIARRITLAGSAFVLFFGVGLSAVDFLIAGFVASNIFHRPEITPLLQFSATFVFAQAVFQSGVSALLGWSQMGKIASITMIQSIMRLAIAVPLILVGYSVYGALVGYAISVALGGVLAYGLLWPAMGGSGLFGGRFASDVKELLSYGRELFIGTAATNFAGQYAVVILATFATNTYVGYYQSASNFTTAITLASGAITQALFPAFAHLDGTGSDIGRAFRYAVKYMGFAITPVIFLLMGASIQLIRIAYGSSFETASSYLTLLALANVSMLLGTGVLPSFFNGVGRPRYYMLFALAGAGLTLVLTPLLSIGAGFGVYGLISGLLIANVVAVLAGLYLASRCLNATIDYRSCLSILAASFLSYLCVLGVSAIHTGDLILLPCEVLVFVVVYLTSAPFLRAITLEDVGILGSAFAGLGRFQVVIRPILKYEELVLRMVGEPRR